MAGSALPTQGSRARHSSPTALDSRVRERREARGFPSRSPIGLSLACCERSLAPLIFQGSSPATGAALRDFPGLKRPVTPGLARGRHAVRPLWLAPLKRGARQERHGSNTVSFLRPAEAPRADQDGQASGGSHHRRPGCPSLACLTCSQEMISTEPQERCRPRKRALASSPHRRRWNPPARQPLPAAVDCHPLRLTIDSLRSQARG